MPKSLNYEGLIPVPDAGSSLLKHLGLQENNVAQARVRDRLVRAALGRRADLVVWVGGRLYILDKPSVLDALADELGVLLPPVTTKSARAERALPSSNKEAAAAA